MANGYYASDYYGSDYWGSGYWRAAVSEHLRGRWRHRIDPRVLSPEDSEAPTFFDRLWESPALLGIVVAMIDDDLNQTEWQ